MKLYTLLLKTMNRIWPIEYGGTGSSNADQVVQMLQSNLVDLLYPIGSIYTSTSNTSPNELFGGEWEPLKDRFLFGAGGSYNVHDMGGESSHVLTVEEMPSHTHTFSGSSTTSSSSGAHGHDIKAGAYTGGSGVSGNDWPSYFGSRTTVSGAALSAGAHTHTTTPAGTNEATGGDQSHNNMPPYLVVYMWERIA